MNDTDTLGTIILVFLATVPWLIPLFNAQVRRALVTWVARFRLGRLAARDKTTPDPNRPSVSGLYIYPVKSFRAVSLQHAELDAFGFVGDRRFMLVAPSPPRHLGSSHLVKKSHRFITQRQCPSLATIEAHFDDKNNKLTLSSSLAKPKTISVDVFSFALKSKPIFHAGIWDDVVEVVDLGDEAADFCLSVTGDDEPPVAMGVRLVSMLTTKPVDDRYVPPAARTLTGDTPQTSLNDGFPMLIACEASLQELNRKLQAKGKETIPMSRFRPNIVVKDTRPFEEDTWKAIRVGDTILHVVKGCPRCKQSCTDQETGKVFEEPLATLADFRALGRSKENVYFAQNVVAHRAGSTISVGDVITVLTTGDPVWDTDKVKAE